MDKLKLANRIKTERNNRNISQKQLAGLTGINNTVLSRMENGEKDISIEKPIKIAKALDVDVGYLLFDCISENLDELTESILKQVNKLSPEKKKLFADIMIVLLENNKLWMNDPKPCNPSQTVNYTEIGKRIRHERLKQGKTQEKLSEDVGVTDNFLSALETGRESMSLDTLFRIAHALKVPVSRLLIKADTSGPNASLCDVVEGLSHASDRQSGILLHLVTLLLDNSDRW